MGRSSVCRSAAWSGPRARFPVCSWARVWALLPHLPPASCVVVSERHPRAGMAWHLSCRQTVPDKVPLLTCIHLPEPAVPQPSTPPGCWKRWLRAQAALGLQSPLREVPLEPHTSTERFYLPASAWCLCFPQFLFVFIDGVLVTFKFHVLETKN